MKFLNAHNEERRPMNMTQNISKVRGSGGGHLPDGVNECQNETV